jgi:hypothetical protein
MRNKKQIFVAEDADDDFFLLKRAFSRQMPDAELCGRRMESALSRCSAVI